MNFYVLYSMIFSTLFCEKIRNENYSPPKYEINQYQQVPSNFKVPQYITNMIKDYPQTSVLLDYYKDFYYDKDYFSRKLDISNDLLTDDVPLFLQWDKRWAFMKYGEETVLATSACAPTCLSMVLCYFTKNPEFHPKYISDFSFCNNYYIENQGTKWKLIPDGGKHFGLKVSKIKLNDKIIKDELDANKILIACVGPGDFTLRGHFIVIKGYNKNGYYLINDPNSLDNSKTYWQPEIVLQQTRSLWALSI